MQVGLEFPDIAFLESKVGPQERVSYSTAFLHVNWYCYDK